MGGKGKKARVHERFATRPGSAMRCDTYDAMQCDLMAEDQRIDSARLDSSDRPGRDGQGEKEAARFTSPISQSISQSSIVNHQPTSSLSAQYVGAPAPSPSPSSRPSSKSSDGTCPACDTVRCCAVLGRYWTVEYVPDWLGYSRPCA